MTQQGWARLAGFLFLWLIVTGMTDLVITSRIAGSGGVSAVAPRIAASERLYRVGLTSALIETISATLLGFALYATLKPIDALLAQLGLYFRLGESIIGCLNIAIGFMRLRMYTSLASSHAFTEQQSETLIAWIRHAGNVTLNVGALFFSLGSLIFFYVFYKSPYIPRVLSMIGIFASVVVAFICFGGLLFPEYGTQLQYGWAPMAIAEVGTAVWLLIFGVKRARDHVPAVRPA